MLDWILEQQDVWQRLQSCRKPVVIYGMGDGAVKILRVMEQYGIRPAALFASDDFARGNLFMGYKVEKLRDIRRATTILSSSWPLRCGTCRPSSVSAPSPNR